MKSFSDFGIEIPYGRISGQIKTYCPQCHSERRDKRDKSLSVDLDRGIWNCHHCGWTGSLNHKENYERMDYKQSDIRHKTQKAYEKPKPRVTPPLEPRALAWFSNMRGISEQTLVDMKITEGPEWMPQAGKEVNTVQFNYFKNGELVNTKFRTGDKKFKFTPKCEILPYNIDNIKGKDSCIITEGEMDTLSFWEIGHHNCISVPAGGANTTMEWLDDYMEDYFDDKKTIYIASDTDTVGVHLKNELIRRFGAERCKVLDYGADCKDANEALVKHGGEYLENCLRSAEDVKVDGVFSVKDFEQDLDSLFDHGLQRGVTLGFPNFDELCSFETKRLCVVTGVPGCLDENTLVSMSDGSRKRIADIKVGDKVQSLQADYSPCIGTVTNKWDSGKKVCYELVTRDGHVILATGEHRFLTFDGWKQLKNIKEGDYMGIPRMLSYNGVMNIDVLKLTALWLAEGNKHTTSYCITTAMQEIVDELKDICKRNNLTLSNNKDLQYIVGTRKPLKITRDRYISSISWMLRKKLSVDFETSVRMAEEKYQDRITKGVSSFSPMKELKVLGCWKETTNSIRVPNTIMGLSNKYLAVFLNWLFACNGCISKGGLEYCSNSRRFCEDIQILLSRFGIISTVRRKNVMYNNVYHTSYILAVQTYTSIKVFAKEIGIIGKQGKLEAYLNEHKENYKSDYILSTVKTELVHGSKFYKSHLGINMSMNDHSKIRVNREMVIKCAICQDNNKELIVKLDNNCAWAEIKSIREVGLRHTYDIEVDDTHNFFANGICTHNSGKSEFIDEMAERLNVRYGWRFAFFSPENAPLQYHAAKLIEKFTGKKFGANTSNPLTPLEYKEVKQHLQDDFSFIAPSDYKLDTILEKARFLVRKRGIKCLVIDPYNRLEDEQGAKSETRYISAILDKLQNFAQQEDVLAILMAHPTKMPKDKEGKTMVPTLYDISGSANFYNKADFGIIVNRDREANQTEVRIEKVKFRHLGQNGKAYFKYNLNNGRYTPIENGQVDNIEWDNANHLADLKRQRETSLQQTLDFNNGAAPSDLPFAPTTTDKAPF